MSIINYEGGNTMKFEKRFIKSVFFNNLRENHGWNEDQIISLRTICSDKGYDHGQYLVFPAELSLPEFLENAKKSASK